ncbi:hypothetical protein CMV_022339 [Castanea mollissima]|uniref:Uncharacterized protein n=1 Tax=Castanea mollissima TaxID=60419 RepID=A0A8J4QME8_9ROSI|nr:hypothetical protein CMV_022339 [Castanea mollissima]
MGTEILRPQDCLIERIRVPQPAPKTGGPAGEAGEEEVCHHGGAVGLEEVVELCGRSESGEDRSGDGQGDDFEKRRVVGLEDQERVEEGRWWWWWWGGGDGLVVTSTERLGPAPEMVPKQIRIVDPRSPSPPTPPPMMRKCDMYAGSAFAMSPAPSSLPLPSFSKKKQVVSGIVVDDSATRDLRRLLRLDL